MTHRNTRENPIVDPRAFLRSEPPASPIWALVDSFDAAANGMTNPEASARLSQVEEEAFRPWQALVSALRAFYSDDAASLLDALDRISDAAPPAVLKPLFRAWALSPDAAAEEILSEASAAVVALHGRVLSQIRPIEGLAEQAEEALSQGMIQHALRHAARCL